MSRRYGFPPRFGIGRETSVVGFTNKGPTGDTVRSNFVAGTHTINGQSKSFADIYSFSRDSLAWIAKDATIIEYAKNVPRITSNGLLIEKQATNYARWSFLPEDGGFRRSTGIYFHPEVGVWTKVVSTTSSLYVNSPEALSGNVVASVCAVPDYGNVSFTRMVFDNAVVPTTRLPNTNVFYFTRSTGTSGSNTGVGWDSVENVATSSAPMYFQIEQGTLPTSPIKTTTTPVTRLADILSLNVQAYSVWGDWDSTLSITVQAGALVVSGYGRIRAINVN